jgi:hypothetical protein
LPALALHSPSCPPNPMRRRMGEAGSNVTFRMSKELKTRPKGQPYKNVDLLFPVN